MDHSWQGWGLTPHIIGLQLYHSLSVTARLVVLHVMLQFGSFYGFQYLLVCKYKSVCWTNDLRSPPITVPLLPSEMYNAGHLISSDQSVSMKMFTVLFNRQFKVSFYLRVYLISFSSRNLFGHLSFDCSIKNLVKWTAINLVALGTNPFMTAVHQKMFHAPLEAKNGRIFFFYCGQI